MTKSKVSNKLRHLDPNIVLFYFMNENASLWCHFPLVKSVGHSEVTPPEIGNAGSVQYEKMTTYLTRSKIFIIKTEIFHYEIG